MGLLEDIIDNKEKFKRRFKTLGENGFSVPSGGFIERIIQEKQELSREQAIGREASAIVASEPDSITDAPRVQESIVPRFGRIDDSGINGSGIIIP